MWAVRSAAVLRLSFSGSLNVFVVMEARNLRKGSKRPHPLVVARLGEAGRIHFARLAQ